VQGVGSRGYILQRYLDDLTSYAETVVNVTIGSSEFIAEGGADSVLSSSNDGRSEQEKTRRDRGIAVEIAATTATDMGKSPQGSGAPEIISPKEIERWEVALLFRDDSSSPQEAAGQASSNPPSSIQDIQGKESNGGDRIETLRFGGTAEKNPTKEFASWKGSQPGQPSASTPVHEQLELRINDLRIACSRSSRRTRLRL
jgi:hypothetical protein